MEGMGSLQARMQQQKAALAAGQNEIHEQHVEETPRPGDAGRTREAPGPVSPVLRREVEARRGPCSGPDDEDVPRPGPLEEARRAPGVLRRVLPVPPEPEARGMAGRRVVRAERRRPRQDRRWRALQNAKSGRRAQGAADLRIHDDPLVRHGVRPFPRVVPAVATRPARQDQVPPRRPDDAIPLHRESHRGRRQEGGQEYPSS
mmetsp:Transcript_26444/g.85478  ORF Transcript_26444/g.85478 Transcript_26444/m.85478 type:complete len:203 (-) Transcript_26444:1904-2512(-)